MALNHVTLDDKYDLSKSRIFVTGFQALVRLCLMQKERDRRAGLHTAGYVTGYRGSPLGTLDQQFVRARKHLDAYDIRFQAGINEDLAATALWGTQQAELRGEGRFDGVFGLWYGKGPGVDRSGDVFRHANFAGTSPHGGVLALMGDDHTAESSTTAHQSESHVLDVRQALDELSLDEVKCNDLGIRLYKIACPWPISKRDLKDFAEGLELIIVVEEKRSLIEVQVREELYGTANQPICIGKKDEQGNWLFPVKGALDPNDIAICIGERILARRHNEQIAAEVARLKKAQRALAEMQDIAQ